MTAYGAVAGDTRDDTAAFTAALAAAAAPNAATRIVKLATGTYRVRPDAVVVPTGVTLTGAGATVVPHDDGFSLLGVGSSTVLEGLVVDGQNRVVRGVTVRAGSTNVRLSAVTVRNVAPPALPTATGYAQNRDQVPAGIRVEGDSVGVLLDRVTVDGVRGFLPSDATPTFYGGFEGPTPLATWSQELPATKYAAQMVANPSRSGAKAMRVELRKGDPIVQSSSRSELARARHKDPLEEHWYGFSHFLPDGGAEDYQRDSSMESVAQWHSWPDTAADRKDGRLSPPLALMTNNGNWELRRWWDANPVSSGTTELWHAGKHEETVLGSYEGDKGRWTDWAFHVKWGWQADQEPLLEVYKNRQLVHRTTGPNTYNDVEGNYFKWGFYKWDWAQGNPSRLTSRVAYFDEYREDGATGSLESVSPPTATTDPYPTARGILVSSGPGQTVPRNVTIRASTVRNVGPKDDGDCVVIQGNGADVEPLANFLVTGSTFSGCAKRAVKVQVSGATVSGNKVDNSFLNTNPYLVRPRAEDPADMFAGVSTFGSKISVTGNTFTGVGAYYAGVEVASASPTTRVSDVTVSGNTVVNGAAADIGTTYGIRVSAPVDRLTVKGNTLKHLDVGLRCDVLPTAPAYAPNTVLHARTPYAGCVAPATGVESAPLLRSLGGSTVTVTGTGFGASAAEFRTLGYGATVNGASAQATWLSPTAFRAAVPAGAPGSRVSVALTRGGVAATPATAGTYAAMVSAATPTTGPTVGGTTVTLAGKGFLGSTGWRMAAPDDTSVAIAPVASKTALAAAPSGVVVLSDTSAVVKTPAAEAGAYSVTFTPVGGAPYGPTSKATFTYSDLG